MTTALAMTTKKTHQAGIDLLRIVRINEEIKAVVSVAFKINIMALNAIFLAKRAGTAARGFGVLSNELRVFSQDLRDCMSSLSGLVHGCVNDVSLMLQDIRQTRLLRQAVALSNEAHMVAVLARREAALAAREAQLEQEQAKLEAARAEAPEGRKTFLNNNDPDFVNPKEKLYDKFPLTVHQMDIIIGVLFALILLFLVLGMTHTSFFGLFGG